LFIEITQFYSNSLAIKKIQKLINCKMSINEFIDYITSTNNPYTWIDNFTKIINM
jgi:hypothetical protein